MAGHIVAIKNRIHWICDKLQIDSVHCRGCNWRYFVMKKTPRANIELIDGLIEIIKCHPMCAKLVIEQNRYIVYYPDGMFPNGARICTDNGKIVSLRRLHSVLERHWEENGING